MLSTFALVWNFGTSLSFVGFLKRTSDSGLLNSILLSWVACTFFIWSFREFYKDIARRLPFLLPRILPMTDSCWELLDMNSLKKFYFVIFSFLVLLNTRLMRYLLNSLSLNYAIPDAIRNLLSYSLSMLPELSRSQSLKILFNFYCLFCMWLQSRPKPNDASLFPFYSIKHSSTLFTLLLIGIDSPWSCMWSILNTL